MIISDKKGFTLLEMILVLSIISILALIMLSFLGASRDKGKNSSVKENLVNARSQAALYFVENNNSYTGLCTNSKIVAMIQSATRAVNIVPKAGSYEDTDVGDYDTEVCHASGASYAIWVPLTTSASGAAVGWCIDANYTSAQRSVASSNALLSSVYVCP